VRLSLYLVGSVALLMSMGGCASPRAADGPPLSVSIGCRGPYEDVTARLIQLHFDLKITADQEFDWIGYENAYKRYAEEKTAAQVGGVNGPSRRHTDDGRFLRRSVRGARDQLYMSLSSEQKMYADMIACRLAYP
jgi:hypothetical protein